MDIKQYFKTCLAHWRWFVATTAATVAIAILFLLMAAPRYERSATVLVKDETGGGGLLSSMASSMGMLAGMAGINIASNVNNEMEILASPALMMQVIERLALDTRYETYSGLMKHELWQETLPVKITFPKLTEKDGAYMKMDLRSDGTFTLYKMRLNKDKQDGEVTGRVNEVTQTPLGPVSVIATKHFQRIMAEEGELTLRITKERRYEQAETMLMRLDVALADDMSNIIHIGYQDQIGERAELIITTLLKVYQEEWMKDKKTAADLSTHFINERIRDIEAELTGLDTEIAQFRGRNLMPDYQEAAKMYMDNAATTYEAQVKVNNQLYIMEHMLKEVERTGGSNQVLPANLLPDNENVALQIAEYNKLQLQRNAMAENSSDQNPLVKDLDAQLLAMRQAISGALIHGVAQLRASQKAVNQEDQKLKSQIGKAPGKVTEILPQERQHKIVEALYIFLLEKREENSLTQVYNSQNLRIVSPALGKSKPVFPKKILTLAVAFTLGLCLPACLIFMLMTLGITKK